MSTLVWALGGVLAVVTSVLYAPRTSSLVASALGPGLLVRALAASLIGRLTNLPLAFGSAVVLGVIDNAIFASERDGSRADLVIFLIVLGALLLRARDLAKANRDSGTIAFGTEARALPRATAALPPVRALKIATLVACGAAALALPLVVSQSKAFLLTNVCVFALVGLSLTLLTGWAGQVSLGQFAIVGVGAFATSRIVGAFDPSAWYTLPLALVASAVAGAVVAVVVGLPAVRIQGLFLAVATLSFGVVATGYVFQRQWIVGDVSSVGVERPPWLATGRSVYLLALGILVVVAVLVRNLRQSGPGRLLVAVRDNDKAARADGVSATGARLVAFAASGAMAAVAGCVFAYSTQRFTASSFPPTTSYTMLSMVIIGGLGSIPGALLGAVFLFGVPALLGTSDLVQLAVSGFGLLVFLLFFPKGLIGIVAGGRDAFASRARRRADGLPAPPRLIPPIGHMWAVARGLPVPVSEVSP